MRSDRCHRSCDGRSGHSATAVSAATGSRVPPPHRQRHGQALFHYPIGSGRVRRSAALSVSAGSGAPLPYRQRQDQGCSPGKWIQHGCWSISSYMDVQATRHALAWRGGCRGAGRTPLILPLPATDASYPSLIPKAPAKATTSPQSDRIESDSSNLQPATEAHPNPQPRKAERAPCQAPCPTTR